MSCEPMSCTANDFDVGFPQTSLISQTKIVRACFQLPVWFYFFQGEWIERRH